MTHDRRRGIASFDIISGEETASPAVSDRVDADAGIGDDGGPKREAEESGKDEEDGRSSTGESSSFEEFMRLLAPIVGVGRSPCAGGDGDRGESGDGGDGTPESDLARPGVEGEGRSSLLADEAAARRGFADEIAASSPSRGDAIVVEDASDEEGGGFLADVAAARMREVGPIIVEDASVEDERGDPFDDAMAAKAPHAGR